MRKERGEGGKREGKDGREREGGKREGKEGRERGGREEKRELSNAVASTPCHKLSLFLRTLVFKTHS